MAPNLVELEIRNLKITNEAFIEIVRHLSVLKIIDISSCTLLEESGIIKLVEANTCIVKFIASNCVNAITDESLSYLAKNTRTNIEILDISSCSNVTNTGMMAFAEAKPEQFFTELYLGGLTQVTNAGFASIISTCTKTLVLLNMSLNSQFELTGEVCKCISKCFELQILDLTD